MPLEAKRSVAFLTLVSVIAVLCSCSSAPSGPEKGTPGFYWQAARETFAAGDYNKTLEHLDQILASDNEYTARALPWSLMLSSGMAAGYMDVADNYALGARVNKSDPTSFHRQVSDNRAMANRMALQLAENFGKVDKLKGDTVPLAFGYPKGNAAPIAQFKKVAGGMPLPPAEMESVQQQAVERGVLLAACRAAGAANDTAKAEQVLNSADPQVPRATFMAALADGLFSAAQLYSWDKLDQPQRVELLCQRAQEALKAAPQSKETKELSTKIQNLLKKSKRT
ncbi:MAG TPA: hypothetical protein VE959_01385 [Bryobacteraceae bacterium]|nr:hypothetical protein [Bryobacteraceae bacterium]